ncbi:MAG: hypothetical protein KatS3mg035_0864 [Bacteroidia bacterium]|nr:MAG: hypothetical protein KatS3mg035_0864 [Bacteroidia bacterium]
MYLVGFSKKDITPFLKGIGMMGWCKPGNVVEEVESNLFARAVVIEYEKEKVAIVVTETATVTLAMRQMVLKQLKKNYSHLGLHEKNVMLLATHTHSAPGGNSHYLLYNVTIPGYSQEVTETYVNGIIEAIVEADKNKEKAFIYFGKSAFKPDIPVAFNRAIEAWNQNPENEKYDEQHRHLALDRNAYQLTFLNEQFIPMGILNFFAVHTTTVHSDKKTISSDNKGYAANQLENLMRIQNPHFVAMFAQGAAGDVTPNFIIHKGDKEKRGETPDDYINRKINGTYQMEKAQELIYHAKSTASLPYELDYSLDYFDMTRSTVDPEWVDGQEGLSTGDPCFGVHFIGGTAEGLGIPPFWIRLLSRFVSKRNQKLLNRNEYYKKLFQAQAEKIILINCKKGEFAGTKAFHKLPIPDFIDPFLAELKRLSVLGELHEPQQPLVPDILPFQIIKIGDIAIAAAPTELTTTSGLRIQKQIRQSLKGIKEVIVAGYANAYASYTATPEEYAIQHYEGASTLYGKYSLPAIQTHFKALIQELHTPKNQRKPDVSLYPYVFSEEELKNRLFKPFESAGFLRAN